MLRDMVTILIVFLLRLTLFHLLISAFKAKLHGILLLLFLYRKSLLSGYKSNKFNWLQV